ncbi:MAG: hypothetical protein JWQ27_3091 [Ferruginibacter sp.]|nr:hypothetical protein [Ferruginibacter sp.]
MAVGANMGNVCPYTLAGARKSTIKWFGTVNEIINSVFHRILDLKRHMISIWCPFFCPYVKLLPNRFAFTLISITLGS